MNWIKQLFSRRRLYSDLSEEIREHLEEKVAELVASGLSREEATTAARREFGNVTLIEERSREVWQWPSIENFFMDVRYGLRMLAKNPGFTAVAVLTLALGIGATTAMFSIVDGAFLKSLPVSDPGQFVGISMQAAQGAYSSVSFPDYLDLRAQCSSLSGVVAIDRETRFVNSMDESSLVAVDEVSLNYFDVLGIRPLLGRTFPHEAEGSAPLGPTVVISYTLWKNRLGGDPGIVGKTIRLNNQSTTVLGVTRERFRGLARFVPTDAWLPLDASELKRRDSRYFEIVGLSLIHI